MEARIGGDGRQFYGIGAPSFDAVGRGFEWDLNDWKWDGDLFLASRTGPITAAPSGFRKKPLPQLVLANGGLSNSSSSCSEETDCRIIDKGKRRMGAADDDRKFDEPGSLALNLGGNACHGVEDLTNWDAKNGKRTKVESVNTNRSLCQVEGCGADLSDARDYHRRHKVCEMHAKATSAVVGNVVQRFCQQCSRFHLLQEFDEGKRSCRRRLAGHNNRRRKTQPDVSINGQATPDDKTSSYLLISLLKILANVHGDSSDKSVKSNDQVLLSHLLRNLASLAGSSNSTDLTGLLQATQDTQKLVASASAVPGAPDHLFPNECRIQESTRGLFAPSPLASGMGSQIPSVKHIDLPNTVAHASVDMPSKRNIIGASLCEPVHAVASQKDAFIALRKDAAEVTTISSSFQKLQPAESTVKRFRLNDFDLNDAYDESQECMGRPGESSMPVVVRTGSPNYRSWAIQDSHQASPPQTSGNSDSASAQSLSSSNGDIQSRTDRIVFKLFGKDPSDFPIALRVQILDWLSHSPSDMESYIRPGCVILTIYLRLKESVWEEICSDLSASLNRLLCGSDSEFWRKGWIYARVRHQIAFIHDGHVVLNRPLLTLSPNLLGSFHVVPIAVSISASVVFTVKGLKLAQSFGRILCAFDGKYLEQEASQDSFDGANDGCQFGRNQSCSFSCVMPNAMGRGFVEIEDSGLGSVMFPFVVAEEDVCSEIRTLEKDIDMDLNDDQLRERLNAVHLRDQAVDFLHEIGWLLRRVHRIPRNQEFKFFPGEFSLGRFRKVMSFAMDRAWCAVVKKLMDVLFEGHINLDGLSPNELVTSECLLHRAVRMNCRPLVEMLLRYVPSSALEKMSPDGFLFRPDMPGPSNISPLHIASTISSAEGVVDALTDDPGQFGIKAWKSVRDSLGFTPEDYARSRGYDSYIRLVQKKAYKRLYYREAVLDIPCSSAFQMEMKKGLSIQPHCKHCRQQRSFLKPAHGSLLHRPVILSMVGIATVCVCVAILMKTLQDFKFMKSPFNWDHIQHGSI